MATLKTYATQLIDALDRPFDEMFLRRVMDLIINERASLIRQELNKGDSSHYYTFPYNVELEIVNGITENIIYGRNILRSINKIPTPIRINSPEPFVQVSGIGGPTLTFVAGATEYKFRENLDKVGNAIVYMWRNNRIYILNNLKLRNVIAVAAYENPYVYIDGYEEGSIICDEDMEFPIPIDLIGNIKSKLLSGELSIIDDKDKVTPAHVDNN
jgi:hypothetical protein